MSNDATTPITIETMKDKLKGNKYIFKVGGKLSRHDDTPITDKLTVEQLQLILDWYKQEGVRLL